MNEKREIREKAEAEMKKVFDQLEIDRNLLYDSYKDHEPVQLDGHGREYKALTKEAFKKITDIKVKYGIE